MKYLRKAVLLIIVVVLLASVVIGAGVVLSVRNVNVTLISSSFDADSEEAYAEIAEYKEKFSRKVKGNIMFFVSEYDVSDIIEDGYEIESFGKIYPCTLNITLRERRETFAVAVKEGGYRIYDQNGKYISNKENNINGLDGAPDFLLEGAENADELEKLVNISKDFKSAFSSLRGIAEKAVLTKARVPTEKDKVTFYLFGGLKVDVLDYAVSAKSKLSAANSVYSALSPEKRLCGTIFCSLSEGAASAVYHV